MEAMTGITGVLTLILLIILAVLWFILPFIIYGMSKKMTALLKKIDNQTININETNKQLWEITNILREMQNERRAQPARLKQQFK